MHPTFHLGPLDFPAYFTLLTIGYMLATLLAWRESWKIEGVDPNKFLDLAIVLLIAGLLGARLLHVIADGHFWDYVNLCIDPMETTGRTLRSGRECTADVQCVDAKIGEFCNLAKGTCHQARDCLRAVKIWYGGLAFYGGLFLAIPAGVWYIRRHRDRLTFWKVADLAGFGIALGLVFGRLGCWLAGCCFGGVATDPHGVVFPRFSPAWDRHVELDLITRAAHDHLPVWPTQLWHVAANLSIFLITYVWFKKWRRYDGQVFWLFMVLYAVSRFILEFWRDDHRGIWLGGTLSTSQILGIPVILAAVFIMRRLARAPRQAPPAGD
jgi:phosphatidylglycerol:prolipoprotein diacylglycerol transferase